jgi:hypothetical protein
MAAGFKKIHPPKPPKPPDRLQNMKTMKPFGKNTWVSAHWRWNYETHKWEWVIGHWSE